MTQKLTGDSIGTARAKQFCAIIMREGEIKRGVVVSRMNISEQTFAHEYLSYMDKYTAIKYDTKQRLFTFQP